MLSLTSLLAHLKGALMWLECVMLEPRCYGVSFIILLFLDRMALVV